MKYRVAGLAIVTCLASGLVGGSSQKAFAADEQAVGQWLSEDGKLTVKIFQCAPEKLCGQIAGLSKPLDKKGRPKVDDKNPDPALRTRPLIGTPVFSDMKSTGENKWAGKIYYAKDGRTYRASAKLKGNKFVVTACWAVLCKKFAFDRLAQQ
jgi:uncharacterized protein (DUF2147 family)